MKRVKFNAHTSVHMIPDDKYPEIKQRLEDLELEDVDKHSKQLHVLAGRYRLIDVAIDEVLEVPDWYYAGNKMREVDVSISVPNFKFKNTDKQRPFDTQEALPHGYLDNTTQTMKKVKLFELVTDNADIGEAKRGRQNTR